MIGEPIPILTSMTRREIAHTRNTSPSRSSPCVLPQARGQAGRPSGLGSS